MPFGARLPSSRIHNRHVGRSRYYDMSEEAKWGSGWDCNLLITHAEDEWLRTIRRPQRVVIEGSSVPNDLEHQLRKLDWMGRRTWTIILECSGRWVGDMRSMIGAIELLPIPATIEVELVLCSAIRKVVGLTLGI